MADALPRYSRRPLPAQRHLPGRAPRPVELASAPAAFDAARWWQCEDVAYGVDLWNRGFFWEAHEAWEAPWRAAGRGTEAGRLLQGLILLAAAAVKHELRAQHAARRLAARGASSVRDAGAARTPAWVAFAAGVEAWVRGEAPTPPLARLDDAAARAGSD